MKTKRGRKKEIIRHKGKKGTEIFKEKRKKRKQEKENRKKYSHGEMKETKKKEEKGYIKEGKNCYCKNIRPRELNKTTKK